MAADEFKDLARVGFAGIEFPVTSYRLHGSIREHVHVYAHVPGGDIEKLGRNLYEAEVRASFLTSAVKYAGGVSLWPGRLALLRRLFEQEITDYLVLPSVGRIKMVCIDWEQEFTAQILNGEHATFRFREDQSAAFLLDQLVTTTATSVESTSAILITKAQALANAEGNPPEYDIFDTIQRTADSVIAIRDQADLGGLLIAEKIAMLTNLCAEADKSVRALREPENFPVIDALRDLWAAAQSLSEAVIGPPTTFQFYEPPIRMTAAQVSTAIFGSSDRATDILELNPIQNAYDIPARTRIRYIPVSQDQAA